MRVSKASSGVPVRLGGFCVRGRCASPSELLIGRSKRFWPGFYLHRGLSPAKTSRQSVSFYPVRLKLPLFDGETLKC